MTATQPSTTPLSMKILKEYSVTLFHQVFEGVSVFQEFAKKIGDLQRNFVQPTLSNLLLSEQAVLNPVTRWWSSTTDLYKTLFASTSTKALKACR